MFGSVLIWDSRSIVFSSSFYLIFSECERGEVSQLQGGVKNERQKHCEEVPAGDREGMAGQDLGIHGEKRQFSESLTGGMG